MVDKIITVPRTKIGKRVGRLADEDMVRLNRVLSGFPGYRRPGGKRVAGCGESLDLVAVPFITV